MKSWIVTGDFDGEKFAARYGLDAVNGDFSMNGNVLTVKPDHLVTDDPPIFEPPDLLVPVPAGIQLHHWPEMLGWQGNHKVFADENGGGPHHECYYIIADNQATLDTLNAFPNLQIEIGQMAYLKNKKGLVFWDGTKWS